MNEVYDVLCKNGVITFILKTDGDKDFWWWEVSEYEFCKFFEKQTFTPDMLTSDNMKDFVNSEKNSTCGCSCGSFLTVKDAIDDYKKA